MALPTTITTDGLGTVGCAGPYVSSAGAVYMIVVDDQQHDLRAFKGADPASSFANAGTDVVIGSGADIIQTIAGHQVGDLIHVLSKNSNGSDPVDIRYHVFDMSSDTWTTSNEMIKTNMALIPGFGWRAPIDLTVRADGVVIAIYNGPVETVATVNYDRVYYARKISAGAAWTADIALGTAGVAASWLGGRAIKGALDRVHFFFADGTNKGLYQRTLTSAYSLETLAASPISVSLEDAEVSWAQGDAFITATGVFSLPIYKGFETLHRVVATSVDAPVISVSADITDARSVLHSPIKYVASQAVDGSTLYNVFIDQSNDIYIQHFSSGAWSTPAGFLAGSVSAVYANIYTRGSALVIGMVYQDTDPKYHEYTLSSLAAGSVVAPQGMLMTGAGR